MKINNGLKPNQIILSILRQLKLTAKDIGSCLIHFILCVTFM